MAGIDLAARFLAGLPPDLPSSLGLAVSGGSDSMAMLYLAQQLKIPLRVITVDHGLRAEAAQEAAFVAQVCAQMGVPHDILKWQGWDGQGNLQAAAREARYGLIATWAQAHGIAAVALGHTMDDQAETFLMRLARGSGVDGLSAMRADFSASGQRWLRPMLALRRSELRDHLSGQNIDWIEDPSNDDTRFDRVRMRQALQVLGDLGIDAATFADTSQRLRMARTALQGAAIDLALRSCTECAGSVSVDLEKLQSAAPETQLRLTAAALAYVSGAAYRPRFEALRATLKDVVAGETRSLCGCLLMLRKGQMVILREFNAVRETRCPVGQLWDGRWQLAGPDAPDAYIAALGELGLQACPDWRDTGLHRTVLLATPAVWQDARLIAAPLAGLPNGWQAKLTKERSSLIQYLESH
ncbi:tRNA(Ile)-lysidine synthetase [Actibacterium atlanticum]|uniref:tRNA(Ile)-lysidine synthase n=1 Tax=Actibacterium atlanticum TaxID=1461693 RepID=A0A058ZPI5_9RHOB|nr:tRNA lysidine(34) synthetase TilS [Actibacterium atlanticum]KCV83077.1 tRNA(Ile)-lysidine synthetase [Actibacterium atlanticum]